MRRAVARREPPQSKRMATPTKKMRPTKSVPSTGTTPTTVGKKAASKVKKERDLADMGLHEDIDEDFRTAYSFMVDEDRLGGKQA